MGQEPWQPIKQCLKMQCCLEARQTSSLELPQRRSARAMALGTPICSCILRMVSWIVSSPCRYTLAKVSQNTVPGLNECHLAQMEHYLDTRSR